MGASCNVIHGQLTSKRIQGELKAGEQLEIRIAPEGGYGMQFTAEEPIADVNRKLRWLGILGVHGAFDGEHFFILEKLAHGRTRLFHGDEFSELAVPSSAA